ncbi:MAG: hypothetical protein NTY53_17005 [Kiritimatiellaeota bacterium]|nr:hypothetical protein [Kiritimatiellota bacterium]
MSDEKDRDVIPNVLLAKNGKPFPNRDAALAELTSRSLDAKDWSVQDVDGGGVILLRVPKVTPAVASATPPKLFFRVVFQEATDDRQTKDVWLNNIAWGPALIFKRGIEVIVPEPHLKLAEQAYYYKFISVPGQAYKADKKVREYMWQVVGLRNPDGGTATEEEFWAAYNSGTQKAAALRGADAAPKT